MTKFCKIVVKLTESEIVDCLESAHFEKKELLQVTGVYEKLMGYLETKVWYEVEENNFCAIVGLGTGVDYYQDILTASEELMKAYMVEVLSMELLKRAYEELGRLLHEDTEKWIVSLEFPDIEEGHNRIQDIVARLKPQGIICTSQSMLRPRKTVVLEGSLTTDRNKSNCHICSQCNHLKCPYRDSQ